MIDLNNIFGIHESALRLRSQRSVILASNLANADTPGFKSRDLDFEEALKNAAGGSPAGPGLELAGTHPAHLSLGAVDADTGAFLRFRNPLQPALDGNTVEPDIERGEFARNAAGYMASLSFMTGRINSILSALKGE